jgi:sugar/nucleoside kinase (ribokinase family)
MPSKSVFLLGDANVDMVINMPGTKAPVQDVDSSAPKLFGGGSTANTAVALARLGIPSSFIGKVGNDGYGQFVLRDLEKEGVEIKQIVKDNQAYTAMILAIIDAKNERNIFVWPPTGGAHTQLKLNEITADFSQALWFHTSGLNLGEAPTCDTLLKSMHEAKSQGVPISLDLNLRLEFFGWRENFKEKVWEAISLADVIFGSGPDELMPITGANSIESALETLCKDGKTIIARLGNQGAILKTPEETRQVPAFKVPVIDTLGAGDAFNGGFIAAQLRNRSLTESVLWGNAVAALKLGKPSARGVPSLKEVENFLNNQ